MMDIAKEFIKRSPGHVLMVLAVGAVILGAIYLLGGIINNMQRQINNQGQHVGSLQQKVNDHEHKIEMLEKEVSHCQADLKVCESRGFIKVR